MINYGAFNESCLREFEQTLHRQARNTGRIQETAIEQLVKVPRPRDRPSGNT